MLILTATTTTDQATIDFMLAFTGMTHTYTGSVCVFVWENADGNSIATIQNNLNVLATTVIQV